MELFWRLLSFSWIILHVRCQLNSPPSMSFNRLWTIEETESVGSVIIRIRAEDNEGDQLTYDIEPKYQGEHIPFTIDAKSGVVYLNESLKGKAGKDINLYVKVSDGHLGAKSEVFARIVKDSSQPTNRSKIHPPGFLPYPPGFNPPTSQIPTFPPRPSPGQVPHFQEKTYPEPVVSKNSTHLVPVGLQTSTPRVETTSFPQVIPLNETDSDNELIPVDRPLKSVPDLAVTLVPVVSVCIIFVIVGSVALVFRKKLCAARAKKCKEDMKKDSGGIVIQEDLAMQQWRGPRAFSNRYEQWDRDPNGNTTQAGNQTNSEPTESDRWEFPRHRLKFFNILGEGAFGQVWKCEALDIDEKDGLSVVAVKTLKENATEKERSDLVSELQVMKMLEPHPNVVRLLGACTDKDPIFVVMEFVSKGKLQSYLRNSRAERYYNNMHGQSKSLTSRDLTSFAYQVAKGMEFLSTKGIIHRDLAARNVLINDEHTCKVADFGFARDVIDSHVYERKSEGRLPIRWMAPESLYDNIFSTKSDVWSFGVLIWEIVTLGSTPYPGLSAAEVMRKVRDGHRLDKPEHCRRELYNIMYYCWDKDPKQRPTFAECIELLEKLIMTETDYIELERFPDHSYYNMLNLSDEKL
ncbi:PREDICTED: tyrosine kinase receptor Cad96Ca [Nicrophorus vespilloides]|uniref:Tyrosine kinase receptor Cad96Ca n=1 Tax=Nicrophorus vespilloides TaxID=110193 RepID=A0ABM1N2R8_NICVS|nr:PREDICTED: tyrosine kinase receptor Cad96Ca [Nicrophorus vespilloides]